MARSSSRRTASSTSRPCCSGSIRRHRGSRCWPASRRRHSWRGTCSRSTTATCDRRRRATGGSCSRRSLAGVEPPVHLTPATTDRALAEDWFHRFEGAGLDGVIAKRLDAGLPARQAGDAQDQASAHRRLRRRRFPLAQEWTRNPRRVAAPRVVRRRGVAPPRRGHLVVHLGQAERSSSPSSSRCARTPSRATRGASGRSGRLRAPRMRPGSDYPAPRPAGIGQGPVVGAAPRGARRRGRVRPSPGRPLPTRHDVQALAARQAADGVPIRSARGNPAYEIAKIFGG